MSLADFKALATKYSVITSGSRTQLAERISNLRGQYLTKSEIEMINPFLKKKNKNRAIFLKKDYPRAVKKASMKARLAKQRRLRKKKNTRGSTKK